MTWSAKLLSGLSLNRHLAPVLTVVFAGVLVSTLVAYFSTRATMAGLALGQARQTLGFLNREIGTRVSQLASRLELWSQEELYALALEDSFLGESARTEAARRMAARVAGSSFDRVFLVRPNGEIVTASNPDMMGRFTVGDRGYFQKALAGKVNMETLAAGRHSNVPMLVIAAPRPHRGRRPGRGHRRGHGNRPVRRGSPPGGGLQPNRRRLPPGHGRAHSCRAPGDRDGPPLA